MGVMFISHAYGVSLSLDAQVGFLLLMLLISKGAATVSGGGLPFHVAGRCDACTMVRDTSGATPALISDRNMSHKSLSGSVNRTVSFPRSAINIYVGLDRALCTSPMNRP